MSDLLGILKKIDDALLIVVPKISIGATNDHLKDNLPKIISQDLATRVQIRLKIFSSNTWNLQHQMIFFGANVTTSSNPTSSSKSQAAHKPRTYAPQPLILAYDEACTANHEINDGVYIFVGKQILNLFLKYMIFFLRKGNTEAKKYILSLHKIHATSFTEDDLEELLKRWKYVSKTRSDPDELFTNKKIVDIVRVRHHEVYRHDQTDEVIVRRNNDKFYDFAQSDDFKYLNKNDIEDMYYIVLRRRKILCILSLVFRLLALFYENNKNEKRVMDINELHKFSDAALKRVLRKISVMKQGME
ncbi:hypothetical protein Tco_0079182 [Tanacetum coccineum]